MYKLADWGAASFGRALKAARVAAGMTQVQLAKQIGVKQQAVSNWENDLAEPTAENRAAIMSLLSALTQVETGPDAQRLRVVPEPVAAAEEPPEYIDRIKDLTDPQAEFRDALTARIRTGPLSAKEIAFFQKVSSKFHGISLE